MRLTAFLLLAFALSCAPGESRSPTGRWEGTLGTGEDAAPIAMDISQADDGRWIGEADFPTQGLLDFRVEISASGDRVRIVAPLPDPAPTFSGALSDEGKKLVGHFTQGDENLPFILEHTGDADLSPELLAIESGAVRTELTVLAADAAALRDRFNTYADRTRLVTILSPT